MTTFPFAPAEPPSDLWRLLRHLARTPAGLAGMRLLRWPAGPPADHRQRLAALLPEGWTGIGYAADSVLLLGAGGDVATRLAADPVLTEGLEVWRPVAATPQGFDCVPAAEAAPGTMAGRNVLTDTRFRYFPLWDVRAQQPFCYLCEPMWDTGDGDLRPEGALPRPPATARETLALDLEVLAEVIRRVDATMQAYGMLSVLVPVHWATLADPKTAERFLGFCGERAWPVVDSLYMELTGPPADVTTADLAAVHERLAPFCRALLLRMATPEAGSFPAVPAELFLSMGISLRGHDATGDLQARLGGLAERAHAARLRCHVHGLETTEQTVLAGQAGVDYLGSDTLAPPLEADDAADLKQPDALQLLRGLLGGN